MFCNKCIRSNLSHTYVKEIEENDDWSCFVCNTNILRKHRAQHWALRNFMNKQLEKIQKITVSSEDELNNLLNEDLSLCCPRRKRKSIVKPVPAALPVKRPAAMSGGFLLVQPPAKKIAVPTKSPLQQYRPSPASVRVAQHRATSSPKNNEIVCTPDIMGLFNDKDDTPQNMVPPANLAPPPLVMRSNGQRLVRPASAEQPQPIYHNVNGFQIDLNHAARQEIFRLPNGKLIQVRKQTTPTPTPPVQTQNIYRGIQPVLPRGPQFTIRQANAVTTTRMFRPQLPQVHARLRGNIQPQQRFTFADGRVVSAPAAQPTQATQAALAQPSATTVFTQQNGSISVARAPQLNTPFGNCKTEFEDKIISGMEICQHTINKMITLSNSTSFKTSRTFSDLKDLYIHLQYLFTYTSGKFKTLQESLTTGMESLAQHDVALKEGDDDELEIVEQKTDVIEVLSDDEEAAAKPEKAPIPTPIKKTILKHIQYTAEDKLDSEKTAETAVEESTEVPAVAKVPAEEATTVEDSPAAAIVSADQKLQKKVVVKVEKLEDTKNPIIKQFITNLKQRQEKVSSCESSREATPDFALPLEVTMDIGEAPTSPIEVPNEEKTAEDGKVAEDGEEADEDKAKDAGDETAKESSVNTTDDATEGSQEPIEIDLSDEDLTALADADVPDILKISEVDKIDVSPPDELMDVDACDDAEGVEGEKPAEVAGEENVDEVEKAGEESTETEVRDESAKEAAEDEIFETHVVEEPAKGAADDEIVETPVDDEPAKESTEVEKVSAHANDEPAKTSAEDEQIEVPADDEAVEDLRAINGAAEDEIFPSVAMEEASKDEAVASPVATEGSEAETISRQLSLEEMLAGIHGELDTPEENNQEATDNGINHGSFDDPITNGVDVEMSENELPTSESELNDIANVDDLEALESSEAAKAIEEDIVEKEMLNYINNLDQPVMDAD